MQGKKRREEILDTLANSAVPISATALANNFGVSRQVIVQDVALLRAYNKNILSTNRGYVLHGIREGACRRVFPVRHSDEDIKPELYLIVDAGAKVLNVIIEHEIYGQISADLFLRSRLEVDEFCTKLATQRARPLKLLTYDVHYHMVEADSEDILDMVEKSLSENGYLISE
ncbi:MAG: transcription repressor NadR [Lachnospiraceae bacterium]|jgi:transcriptional regulator of NAD metabolism|nr:transcription repressor NadR [Lachnospiraceae bacterium]